ncbi:MAG: hypothetical protein CMJ20_06890 [Phycisphaeraceae bacterium]|nr:hypothetical protein [Phycisphaeraceae bacterium]
MTYRVTVYPGLVAKAKKHKTFAKAQQYDWGFGWLVKSPTLTALHQRLDKLQWLKKPLLQQVTVSKLTPKRIPQQ